MCSVSIIVPVYNAENTLHGLCESILNQTNPSFELILVDDGSTDASYEICKAYQEKDIRVKAFHIENNGVSYARNVGIQKASNEIITFIDSDDLITPDYCDAILRGIDDNDLLVFQTMMVSPNGSKSILIQGEGVYIGKDQVEKGLSLIHSERYDQFGWPWNKAYRTEILREYDISFPCGINWYEDEVFSLRYSKQVSKMKVIDKVIHQYNIHDNSLTNTANTPKMMEQVNDLICQEISAYKNDSFLTGFYRQIFRFYDNAALLEKGLKDRIRLYKKARNFYSTHNTYIPLLGIKNRLLYKSPRLFSYLIFTVLFIIK